MTNKILVAIVIVALNVVLISSLAFVLYDTHKRAKRIDAMARTHLEQRQRK